MALSTLNLWTNEFYNGSNVGIPPNSMIIGEWKDITNYVQLIATTSGLSSGAGAGQLYIEQSNDGATVINTVQSTMADQTVATVVAPYGRVRLVTAGVTTLAGSVTLDGIVASFKTMGNASGISVTSAMYDTGGQVFNVKAYGAKGDGTTDDTAAIQTAIGVAQQEGPTFGGTVYFPQGKYMISSPLVVQNCNTLRMAGAGLGNTVIAPFVGTTLNELLYIDNCNNICIEDLQFEGAGATADNGIYVFSSSSCYFSHLFIQSISGAGLTFDGTSSALSSGSFISDCNIYNNGGDGLSQSAFATDNLYVNIQSGANKGHGYYFGGSHVSMTNCIGWGNGTAGCSVDSSSNEVWISNCRFDFNGLYGLYCLGQNVMLANLLIYDNSAAGSGVYPGLVLQTPGNVIITNCRSQGGNSGGTQQSAGLAFLSSPTLQINIADCDFTQNDTAISGLNYINGLVTLTHVLGYNPVGVVGPVGVPASGTAVTNTYSVHVTVYITASASVTIAIGPTTVGTIPSGLVAIPLEPNQTITLTYTTAPTWVWIGD